MIETTIVLWARHRCGSSREEITKCVALRLHLTLHDLEFCRQTNEFLVLRYPVDEIWSVDGRCFFLSHEVIMWSRQESLEAGTRHRLNTDNKRMSENTLISTKTDSKLGSINSCPTVNAK